ncbi:zinc finger protein castor homolog 1 isoform X2 [Perognathus longimembris pacificus]|uniref:zinc finger protein castor homolog 1 isoform X2 n=2 Tax=Perognathus longimembris pacificus TaxID=214514 RepID=UPI0020188BD0|nr:zinc finger protein castor homolog 1 isoform X2 [Perognathus longimembris pacificus]
MKVDYLSEFGFRLSDYEFGTKERRMDLGAAEGTRCTDPPAGKPAMAAKRKGGLKLNAICAKLSRQVVVERGAEAGGPQAEGSPLRPRDKERSGGPESGGARAPRSEEDKRRAVIEKWVNGEYSEEPAPTPVLGRLAREGLELPPEGVYMVQPQGCSDEEDHAHEPGKGGAGPEDKGPDGPASKDEAGSGGKQAAGEASSLRDYAASTMTEFLGMFGYDDQNTRDELARKISFEKLQAGSTPEAAASSALPTAEDSLGKRARFSKYEEYIRKLKAGEQLSWPAHGTKAEDRVGKEGLGPLPGLRLPPNTAHLETKATILPLPSPGSVQMQSLVARASKYDFFIQKLKTGENLRPQNGSTYKKPSKYDLENVKYLHLFKPGEGSPDMGGAIAFKTGKVGRPSKYDVRGIQKPGPAKVPPTPSLVPAPVASMPSTPSAPGPGPEAPASLSFNTPEYLKSTFSKTDSITTGTVSTVKNGLPTDKPAVTEDVNIYQKYIARFSGSQHCGHIHCAYQYREHYHCLDPECNYQRFTSKQDVIRHYNMHKKRDNSLQHGFMRFSPLDDCSVYYHGCHLNGKSTHYHCMQVGCNKVYTSTSDVMTHENFHKKNTQLINDGFQRFRATEDCGTADCQFYGQKTTHFHCRRPGCTFTFKNKCDIEKHKSYHIKDDAYAKDGFKKFYKYEECKYEGCVYSKATNHFHCIRAGCGFTFTSTSQMTSHKRKHERRHIRSSGSLGLPASLLGAKDTEHEESSNDDLVDFSALSSKNSSLSASPTSQQSSASLAAPEAAPSATKPPGGKMAGGLLPQGLPGSIPLALALSNSGLPTAAPYFPLLPGRGSASLPVGAPGLLGAVSSGAPASAAPDPPALVASGAGDSASGAATSVPVPPASIMERISASKGLISPMMARLAAAALKPSATFDPGSGQQVPPARFPQAQVKQEPGESAGTPGPHEASQDHSLDLTVKESSNESNGHAVPANSSLLSSLMNKMSQANPSLGSLLSIKADAEGSPAAEPSPFLGKAVKTLVQDKLSEPWKVYLRRFGTKDFCDAQCDFLHKAHFHCVVEECGALFSTLDGAIKHANFHFRTEGGAAKGSSEASFPASAAETKPPLAPSSPPAPPGTAVPGPSLEGPSPSPASVPSTPTLLAWKQLASTIPQMPQIPASVPHLPASPLATTSLESAKPQVKPGFLQFQDNDPCLTTDCKYANKFHFHCLFGNCKYVCKTSGKAESHCLDHINPNNSLVNVRDQFAYYSLQCLCPNQHCEFRMRGHYHCLRTGCYFVTNITTKLPWHIKKHEKAERRAANGFKYFTKREECGRLGCKYNQVNSHFHCIREGCQFSFLLKHQMTSHARKHMRRMLGKNFDRVPPSQGPPSLMDVETDEGMDYTGCSPGAASSESSTMDRSCSSTPVGNESTAAGNTISMPAASGAKKRFWIIEDMSPFGKRRKTASSRKMLDEGMMLEGFRRFDLYEDCKDAACQFSLKVTHYHCTRENCGYKFCGRTHMYKHAQHHDRVDNLVLDDFKRFKASLSCHFADCPFSGSSTHFHCLRCRFRCTDSTKVTAHRKHHGKQDVISAAGFRQFSSSADCAVPDCKYKLKCSHFHCTHPGCRHTVVGMSQMDSHKRKHDKQERGEPPAAAAAPAAAEHAHGLDGGALPRPEPGASLLFLHTAAAGLGLALGDATAAAAAAAPNAGDPGPPGPAPGPPRDGPAATTAANAAAAAPGTESSQDDDDLDELELPEEEAEDDDDEDDDDDDEDDDDEDDDEDLRTDSEESLPEVAAAAVAGEAGARTPAALAALGGPGPAPAAASSP